jgi:protein-tyrosine phosphatase
MELSDFIDIHSHILPGLDDGPEVLAESLALLRCYSGVGVKRVFATPHFLPGTAWSASPRRIMAFVEGLREVLPDHGINLEIISGMEIAIQKNMGKNLARGRYLPLGESDIFLLEPPFKSATFNPLEPLKEFTRQGKRVILAHPERSEYFQRNPQTLQQAHRNGIAIQINYGSLLGYFGAASEKTAKQLVAWEVVDYLASDAHSAVNRRPPGGLEWHDLQKLITPEMLRQIASVNPGKILT